MRFNELTKIFFVFILILITWAFFNILLSYFSAILWSAILAITFYPVKNKLRKFTGKHDGISSLLTIIIICLIVFIPLIIIISSLTTELNIIYNKLQHNTKLSEIINDLFVYFPEWTKSFLERNYSNHITQIQQKLSEIVLKGGRYLAGNVFLIGKGTFSFAINFGIMLYLLFFLLKDGPYLVLYVLDILPLSNFVKQHLLSKFVTVIRATVKGTVLVAIFQGIVGGITFYIANINSSILLGTIIAFLSLIPTIGSAIIWITATIYLFTIQEIWKGIFIVGFFVIIVGLTDNYLRPFLVAKDIRMPDYLILITTLGGIKIYGINGFIIGPLIAALFLSCWNLLSHDYDIMEKKNINKLKKIFSQSRKKV